MGRIIKLVLNAFVFSGFNKVGIAVGFLAYHYSGFPNQLMIQVPLAVAVSVAGVMMWLLYFGRWHRLDLEADAFYVFLLTFPCGALLIVPIHYLLTGYLTGFGNILGGWVFAFLANVLALVLAAGVWRRRPDKVI